MEKTKKLEYPNQLWGGRKEHGNIALISRHSLQDDVCGQTDLWVSGRGQSPETDQVNMGN
jgi:hypothetical protein